MIYIIIYFIGSFVMYIAASIHLYKNLRFDLDMETAAMAFVPAIFWPIVVVVLVPYAIGRVSIRVIGKGE